MAWIPDPEPHDRLGLIGFAGRAGRDRGLGWRFKFKHHFELLRFLLILLPRGSFGLCLTRLKLHPVLYLQSLLHGQQAYTLRQEVCIRPLLRRYIGHARAAERTLRPSEEPRIQTEQ